MKKLRILVRASLLISIFALHSFAQGDGFIVTVQPSAIDSVARQHRLKSATQLRSEGVYLVHAPRGVSQEAFLRELQANANVQAVESNTKVKLPELSAASNQGKRKIPFMKGGTSTIPMAGNPFSAYTNQLSNTVISLQEAQKKYGQGSSGVQVAVIDTGVDHTHAVLASVINTGDAKSFVSGQKDASTNQETTPFVDQETTPFVDGIGSVVVVQQETTPFVDQETTPFVDQETTPFVDSAAYGHGTMVAGLIHLVAPNVRILPLRAFKSDGSGSLADVIKAIDYAASLGNVQVINMSFSAPETSKALNNAIAAAAAKGIICVASVANDNSSDSVYPANIDPVIGVAASTTDGYRAWFSNYGPETDVAAPGVDVWTTYPSNSKSNQRYAAATGTSFSTGYVSGTVALMLSANPGESASQADSDLEGGAGRIKSPELKAGQLNVSNSVGLAK
jgi:subtilisin family serine protease